MKTKEELNAIKEEVEAVRGKLAELSEEELAEVAGGAYNYNRDGSLVDSLIDHSGGLTTGYSDYYYDDNQDKTSGH